MTILIRKMSESDWSEVRTIYQEGIETGTATFTTVDSIPDYPTWDGNHLIIGRLVATIENQVVGWSAFSPISSRSVYSGVAEISIYTSSRYRRQGIGDQLMTAAIQESENNGLWTIQAGIFSENTASILLHEKHGFRIVGKREKIGKLGTKWKDTLLLERRSTFVGID